MYKIALFCSPALIFAMFGCKTDPTGLKPKKDVNPVISFNAPPTPKDSTKDQYFDTIVYDPYRWLEDDHSEATKAWVVEQNRATFNYLSKIPFRESLKKRMENLFNYEKCSSPKVMGKYFFMLKNNGLQNQDVLYVTESLSEEAVLLIDPNSFSADGTVAMGDFTLSKDERYLALQISSGGSDWNKILIMDMKTRQLLSDTLDWVKFSSIAWYKDGFYYSRYPAPETKGKLSAKNELHSVYYHKVGQDQRADKLIFVDKKHPQRNVFAVTTDDEKYLLLFQSESTSGNNVLLAELGMPAPRFTVLVKEFSFDYNFVGYLKDRFYFHTNEGASNWKVVYCNVKNQRISAFQDLIKETSNRLEFASLLGNKLVCNYLHNASSQVKIFDLSGNPLHEVSFPEIGTVSSVNGSVDKPFAFYTFSSFIRPPTVYKLDLGNFQTDIFFAPKMNFNPDLYTTEQIWFESKDKTPVPVFLTYKKGLVKDGKAPTLLYGYGGFDISLTPSFSVNRIPIIENNGIFAVANLRGGGEFGNAWHQAGIKEKKQNVFDDFIGAAEYLIKHKYTSADYLAIEGGSNGGLLVGACMTQRPELYKVAIIRVGVLDMLRYHKFTIGWAWATDYGTSETKEGFDYLIKYSPLHNIKPTHYPATIIATADHDDRVVPAHSFKFAAQLQAHQQANHPCMIRIDVSAGHGAGKPTSKRIEEATDLLSFMFYQMKIIPVTDAK